MNKMNQTQTRSPRKRLLSLILAVILMIGLLPISAFATSASAQAGEDKAATQDSEFLRIFHLDCGRKYFTVDQIKQMIDYAAESNYTHVELAFGNDGLRFLLDDMSVEVNGTTYASDKVTSAIKQGNQKFYDAGTNELTQSEMQQLIDYAREKKIGIIPMFDAPGHLQAVIRGMQTLGLNVVYTTPECCLHYADYERHQRELGNQSHGHGKPCLRKGTDGEVCGVLCKVRLQQVL